MTFLYWSLAAFTAFIFAPLFCVYFTYGPEVIQMLKDRAARQMIDYFRRKGDNERADRIERMHFGDGKWKP